MDKISQNSEIINSEESTDQKLVHLVLKCLEREFYLFILSRLISIIKRERLKSLQGHIVGIESLPKTESFLLLDALKYFTLTGKLSKEEDETPRASEGPETPSAGSPAIVPDYDPSLAVYTAYVDPRKRLDSFVHWPDDRVQSPQELAVAGFFHTGDGDYLRCYYCGVGRKHWDPDDIPLDEHVRRRPSCGYLRAHFGEEFISARKARLQSRGPVFTNREPKEASGTVGNSNRPYQCSEPENKVSIHRTNDEPKLSISRQSSPEGAIPPPRLPADSSTTSPKVTRTNNDNAPERNNEEEESTDDALLDMMGTTRPAASERIADERCRPPLDPVQSAADPPVDLLAARSQRNAGSSATGSKTCKTELEGDEDGTGQNPTSYDLEKMHALAFPPVTTIRTPATNFEQTNSKSPESFNKGKYGNADTSSHVTTNPKASRDKDNDVNKAAKSHKAAATNPSVQDVLHDKQKAMLGIQMKFGCSLVSQLIAFLIFPQSIEEGLARVNFRSPDREHMNVEGHRVSTLLLYSWADDHAVLRLANAGFYYTGRGDTLACFCCGVTVSYANRRSGEDPYDVHRQLNPNCPHLAGGDIGNVFIQDEQSYATSGRDISGSASQPLGVAQLVSEVRQALSWLTEWKQSQSRLVPEGFSTNGAPQQSSGCEHNRNRTNTASFAAATSNDFHGNGTTGNISNRQQPERATASRTPPPQVASRTAPNTERPTAHHEAGDPSVSEGLQAPTASSEIVYNADQALHPDRTNLEQRIRSFELFPNNDVPSPRQLALAGFFFTGDGDCVRCHYCGLGLMHWDPDDKPLDEHLRWRFTCGFLHFLCGKEFILRTLRRLCRSSVGAVDVKRISSR